MFRNDLVPEDRVRATRPQSTWHLVPAWTWTAPKTLIAMTWWWTWMGVYVGSTCSTRRSVPILWTFATKPTRLNVDLSRRKKSAAETIHHVPPAVWMSPLAQVRVGRHPARAPLPRLRRRPRRFTLATAAIAETGASTAGTAARIAGTVVNMHDSTATVEEVQDGRCEMPGFSNDGQRSTESRGWHIRYWCFEGGIKNGEMGLGMQGFNGDIMLI